MRFSMRNMGFFLAVFFCLCSIVNADNIWDMEAVDADGVGINSKVGASLTEANKVTVEGIALNSPSELLNTNSMWQVYVQAESPDRGGIAAWAGIFYDNTTWPRYTMDIQPGDRIRIEGWVENHNGKVNFTERHTPGVVFTLTKLQDNAGMPSPQVISDLSTCNYFDQSRNGGGERYQAQWVRLDNVSILSGSWAAGNSMTLSDDTGNTITMLLSSQGDFDSYSQPTGPLSILGIFDQEDSSLPYHSSYRVWVKHFSDILNYTGVEGWEDYECIRK